MSDNPTLYAPVRRLAAKFGKIRRLMNFDQMPPQQALFGQSLFIAGAQAAFQILHSASEKSPEEAIIIWGELQSEILNAMPKPEEKIIVEPPPGMKM